METEPIKRCSRFWPWTKRVIERGTETWYRADIFAPPPPHDAFPRRFVVYEVTNRWTGRVTTKKVYLNDFLDL